MFVFIYLQSRRGIFIQSMERILLVPFFQVNSSSKGGCGESDKSFPRGGFEVTAVFFIGAQSHAPNFSPFFLTGVRLAGSGLV